jgi:CheY-like chemotaxis protein
MYKILIVDDSRDSRNNIETALISVSDTNLWQDKRLALAKNHYTIAPFYIVGEAIDYIEKSKDNIPDLALLDISFHTLSDTLIHKAKKDPAIEKSTTRGFDIYDKLKDKTQTMLFTAHVNTDNIVNEIDTRELRQGLDYVTVIEKEKGVNVFSREIKNNLQIVANQLLANANNRNLSEIQPLILAKNPNWNMIFQARFWLDEREFTVQNFFIFKFSLNPETVQLEPNAGIQEYIKITFEDYFNIPIQTQIPNFQGIWQEKWLHETIQKFRNLQDFEDKNNKINTNAANLIVELLRKSHHKDFPCGRNYNIFRSCNIGKTKEELGENAWTGKFINALTVRRILIGLNVLADRPIWTDNASRILNHAFDFVLKSVKKSAGDSNTRIFLSQVLGCSIISSQNPQRLNTEPSHLLLEEQRFVQEIVPQILNKMQRINGNQPAPDYSEF